MTTKQLDELAEEHIRGCGATPSFLGYHGFTGSLCTSVNDEVVHGIPGSRVLAEGDLISIDCGAIVDGWHGDAAISVIVGGRDAGRPEDLALIDATEDSMWAGIAALQRGGVPVRRGRRGRGQHRRLGRRATATTTGSSRSTSATASAPRCTWTRRCRTTASATRARRCAPA